MSRGVIERWPSLPVPPEPAMSTRRSAVCWRAAIVIGGDIVESIRQTRLATPAAPARAAGDERDERALMVGIQCTGAESFAHLLRELAIRSQGGIQLAIDFADHAITRGFRDAFRQ